MYVFANVPLLGHCGAAAAAAAAAAGDSSVPWPVAYYCADVL